MRHPAGQPPQRLQPLALPQRLLGALAFGDLDPKLAVGLGQLLGAVGQFAAGPVHQAVRDGQHPDHQQGHDHEQPGAAIARQAPRDRFEGCLDRDQAQA